ncbi:hypothetical protein [Rubritalea tangerina]
MRFCKLIPTMRPFRFAQWYKLARSGGGFDFLVRAVASAGAKPLQAA